MSPVSSYFKQNYGTGLNRDVLKILENPAPLNQSAWCAPNNPTCVSSARRSSHRLYVFESSRSSMQQLHQSDRKYAIMSRETRSYYLTHSTRACTAKQVTLTRIGGKFVIFEKVENLFQRLVIHHQDYQIKIYSTNGSAAPL